MINTNISSSLLYLPQVEHYRICTCMSQSTPTTTALHCTCVGERGREVPLVHVHVCIHVYQHPGTPWSALRH